MIKILNEFVKCSNCEKSKMDGFELICTEFQEVIEFDETMCTAFKQRTRESEDNV